MNRVREARYAGGWYPADPEALRKVLSECYTHDELLDRPPRPIWGVISPHAGVAYSGPTAARAFSAVAPERITTVVVVAPSHRVHFSGVACWESGAYETPLGRIPIDEEFVAAVCGEWECARYIAGVHEDEHSLELQLPFLQYRFGSLRLVPLVVGGHDRAVAQELALRLLSAIRDRDDVLVVASTDLSHFHEAPVAEGLDAVAARYIESIDPSGLHQALVEGRTELCGALPVLTLLEMGRQRELCDAMVLATTHSGHVSGDSGSVVGYLAAVLW